MCNKMTNDVDNLIEELYIATEHAREVTERARENSRQQGYFRVRLGYLLSGYSVAEIDAADALLAMARGD